MTEETSLYGVAVFHITGDLVGSADVYKRRGGWFTVEVTPFLYAERDKWRKGFRDEYLAREYARTLGDRFMTQALAEEMEEHPDAEDYDCLSIQYSENGIITNDPQY